MFKCENQVWWFYNFSSKDLNIIAIYAQHVYIVWGYEDNYFENAWLL